MQIMTNPVCAFPFRKMAAMLVQCWCNEGSAHVTYSEYVITLFRKPVAWLVHLFNWDALH